MVAERERLNSTSLNKKARLLTAGAVLAGAFFFWLLRLRAGFSSEAYKERICSSLRFFVCFFVICRLRKKKLEYKYNEKTDGKQGSSL